MNNLRDICLLIEFIIIVCLVVIILIQNSNETEIMSSPKNESFDKVDELIILITKFLIFSFFINTLLLLSLTKKITLKHKETESKILKTNKSIYNVK